MQDYCGCFGLRNRIRNELKEALPVIPLIDDSEGSFPPSSLQEISRKEYVALQIGFVLWMFS